MKSLYKIEITGSYNPPSSPVPPPRPSPHHKLDKMKPILTTHETVELYLENFNQLGEAILQSGGNCFAVLKRHDDLLRTLAANKISITAKYDLQKLVKEDPMWQKPLSIADPKQ